MQFPFDDDSSPFLEWLCFTLRFVGGMIGIAALLVWPWVTLNLLNAAAPEREKWNWRPIEYGCLFYMMTVVSIGILLCEVYLRWWLDPIDADDPVREAKVDKRRLIGVQIVSTIFAAFTVWINSVGFLHKADMHLTAPHNFGFVAVWVLLVAAPPVAWFGLNLWRWHNLISRRP